MLETIKDLLRHEQWADAKFLQAVSGCDRGWSDSKIREKLHHIHAVQRFYRGLLKDEPGAIDIEALQQPFATLDALQASMVRYHAELVDIVEGFDSADLQRTVVFQIPGHPDRACSLREAMLQIAMHSHYHRGQIAARLRELGAEPPLTDFITWVWDGRPEAEKAT